MPDDTKDPNGDQTKDQPTDKTPVDFAAWLAEQTDDVKAAYEAHTAGLKTALRSERERAAEFEKAEKARKAAADEAERKRLEEQGQYKDLADQAAARAAELEGQITQLQPLTERVTALETALKTYLDREREGLPAHILALLDTQDVVEQRAYIAANRAALKPPATTAGVPPTPKAQGDGKMTDEERRNRAWKASL